MRVVKAIKADAEQITELTIRSKAYWNYSTQQIEAWSDELTMTSKYIDENHVYKFIVDEILIGFYAYQAKNTKVVKLNFFFMDPQFIGKGYGKKLMADFLQRMRKKQYESIILEADPNAEKFYRRMGFKVIGKLKSSIKDRFLPIMEMKIKPNMV